MEGAGAGVGAREMGSSSSSAQLTGAESSTSRPGVDLGMGVVVEEGSAADERSGA